MDGVMHAPWPSMGDGAVVAAADAAAAHPEEESATGLRRGPWTVEEDLVLINYISVHGEGRWNSLARCAGLKRTGKSCRLRWLNYLRPDVRRGNITPEEQLLILELHSRWGNRWSKIAQYLPGRTDNEIKNYWRTRVQKHAKQLQCDVNSKQFKDIMRYLWMPRLVERIQAANNAAAVAKPNDTGMGGAVSVPAPETMTTTATSHGQVVRVDPLAEVKVNSPESAGMGCSSTSNSMVTPPPQEAVPLVDDQYKYCFGGLAEALSSPCRYLDQELGVPVGYEQHMVGGCGGNGGEMMAGGLWAGMDDFWLLQQQQL